MFMFFFKLILFDDQTIIENKMLLLKNMFQIYYQMSTLVCHCHGYSGTCSQLSCWRRHPNVNDMATVLKKKISEARFVKRSRLNKLIKGRFFMLMIKYFY